MPERTATYSSGMPLSKCALTFMVSSWSSAYGTILAAFPEAAGQSKGAGGQIAPADTGRHAQPAARTERAPHEDLSSNKQGTLSPGIYNMAS